MNATEVVALVRAQIANALEEDLNGGEAIMKEVWEQMDGKAAFDVANLELERIIKWLRRTP